MDKYPLILPVQGNPVLDEMDRYLRSILMSPVIHRPNQFYSINIFNTGVSENAAIIAPSIWDGIHPALTYRPIDWNFFSIYSFVYAKDASPEVSAFVSDLRKARNELAKTDPSVFTD